MKVTLHIGVPKTGSTAIQAHLGLNRGWFEEQGLAIPHTGFSEGYGHVLLFEDTTNEHLGRLRDELQELGRSGCKHALLSWEGLNTFNHAQLDRIREHLEGHEVEVLAYLREQSEVVQSGFLQAIKQRRQKRTLEDFRNTERIVTPVHIDYASLLSRYARAFGEDNLRVRIYERSLLVDGNVVLDFLQVLGLTPDERFILAPNEQNVSLDVGSAYVLNVMDSLFSSTAEREALVDMLLCFIDSEGPDERYFLLEENIQSIREHYAESNQQVMEKYLDVSLDRDTLFSLNKPTQAKRENLDALGQAKFAMLAQMNDYRSWVGQHLNGAHLQDIASPLRGWSTPEATGFWSRGKVSHLRFRICPSKVSVHAQTVRLILEGNYFADNNSTVVSLPGKEPLRVVLNTNALDVPLACFDDFGRIDIVLEHDHPTTPVSLGLNNDDRELAFFIKSARYELV